MYDLFHLDRMDLASAFFSGLPVTFCGKQYKLVSVQWEDGSGMKFLLTTTCGACFFVRFSLLADTQANVVKKLK